MTLFDVRQALIIVLAQISGPKGTRIVRLALDTGSVETVISTDILRDLGLDPAESLERERVTTASGVEYAPRLALDTIKTLGQERSPFPVLGLTLPPSANIDGLLGLDFIRGQQLCIDYRSGTITLD